MSEGFDFDKAEVDPWAVPDLGALAVKFYVVIARSKDGQVFNSLVSSPDPSTAAKTALKQANVAFLENVKDIFVASFDQMTEVDTMGETALYWITS